MIVVSDLAEFPAQLRPSVVTIGKFDGVHCGHRALLRRLREEADARGVSSVAITFDRHPTTLVAPERVPEAIVSLRQKEELLAQTGIDATVVLPFTHEFSHLSPEAFIEQLLVNRLGIRAIVVGRDFRFGHFGAGDVQRLNERGAEFGFETIVLPDAKEDGVHRASSSRVRILLADGDVRGAAEILERNHVVRGLVVHGAKRGRELGFPTANLGPDSIEGFIPADGVYAGWLWVAGAKLPAAISIGNNPTFEGVPQRQVEAYVLDERLDLYDRTVEIEFVAHLRPMVKFDSLAELIGQLNADIDSTRGALGLVEGAPRAKGTTERR